MHVSAERPVPTTILMTQHPPPSLPHAIAPVRARIPYLALALLTIALGLWVHRGGIPDAVARDVMGDALWAMMMAWGFGVLLPTRRVLPRSAAALGVCVAVEVSQLVHTPTLDAIRQTTLGALVLGSGFDARDLLAYALGVGVAALLEYAVVARRARP